jgi:2-iminobutanoate/2-iminopropanoate deaminase
MPKTAITTENAPKAIGPYSQAISADARRLVFLSGQIPTDPATGSLIDGDIVVQTRRAMDNLDAVLRAAGLSFANVVRTTIFLIDLGDFAKVNETYGAYYPSMPPARATVQVAALPRGARVEIDAIAAE